MGLGKCGLFFAGVTLKEEMGPAPRGGFIRGKKKVWGPKKVFRKKLNWAIKPI